MSAKDVKTAQLGKEGNDEYILVRKPTPSAVCGAAELSKPTIPLPEESKSKTALQTGTRVKSHMLSAMRPHGKKKKGGNVVLVQLQSKFVLTSAANTALTSVQALSPIGVSDFDSFASLYDLCRVHSISADARVNSSAAVTGAFDWALAFDPSNIGTYASLPDVLTAKHHMGPFVMAGGINISPGSPLTPTGFKKMSFPLEMQRVTNDSTASNVVGGGWFGTSDTTAVVGWLKPYIDPLGGALTSSITCYVTYNVEFKSRT